MQTRHISLRERLFKTNKVITVFPPEIIFSASIEQQQISDLLHRKLIYEPYRKLTYLPPRCFYISSAGAIFNTNAEIDKVKDLWQILLQAIDLENRQAMSSGRTKRILDRKLYQIKKIIADNYLDILVYQITYPEQYCPEGSTHIEIEREFLSVADLVSRQPRLDFDSAVAAYSHSDYTLAENFFRRLLEKSTDNSVTLPALLGLIKTLLAQGRKFAAEKLLVNNLNMLASPSPKAFPQLWLQTHNVTLDLPEAIFDTEELTDVFLMEQPRKLLAILADSYIPFTYAQRENALRNFYLSVFLQDSLWAENLTLLQATYIKKGFFALHQLLNYFLRAPEYAKVINLNINQTSEN